MSKNPLTLIMETNKFNGMNYNDWLRNMSIVLDFENQGYVLDKPLPMVLPEGSSPEERIMFERWLEDNHKAGRRSPIMLHIQEVYAVPDRHIRYATTKAIFGTKMAEGLSVQNHTVKILSLVEKLEDLKGGIDNPTYIDVILQSLSPSYDPFIINYNMNGLEKFIPELINMLVQYEATNHKSAPVVLVGEASTSKTKGKRAGRWKRKKGNQKVTTATANTKSAPAAATRKGTGKGKVGGSQQLKANDVCMYFQGKGHWKRECPQLLSNPAMFVIEVNMVTNIASWVLDIGYGAHICNNLQVLERNRKLSKDEMALRLGHINKDRIRKLVDSKSLEIGDLDNLPTYEFCLKGKIIEKPFVGQTTLTNGTSVRHLEGSRNTDLKLRIKLAIRSKPFAQTETPPGTPQLNGMAERRNRTLLDMVRSIMSFTELPPSFWGYVLETAVKLLNMEPSKTVPQMPYEIWHGTPSSYKYLRVWGSLAYVKRLRIVVFLEKGFLVDCRRDEVLFEESGEPPQQNDATSFEPSVPTNGAPVLRRTYGEAMSDIDSDKWLEAMEFEMDSIGSNQVWILVDPPKGVKSVGCKLVYKRKIRADGEPASFKARLVAKGYTQRPGIDFGETYSPIAMAKSIRILLTIATWYDCEIWHMDEKTAFLNGYVEEEIYMDQQKGFTFVGE
ncbi:UNVERIFIED_CONTAM: Retrovirus-related Pol polyprotein from transposon RE2 [Sesamum angustifolium]|uniref:Retrovirus-related Pol polyprotein from transposon RE2 n=1 Tax=Sesamum angustifolium TaxID=2727405 RepID=A0AAW2QTA4_9LAMI